MLSCEKSRRTLSEEVWIKFSMAKPKKTRIIINKKRKTFWTEEHLQEALHELDSVPGASIWGVSKKYGFDESTLRFQLKRWHWENMGLQKVRWKYDIDIFYLLG